MKINLLSERIERIKKMVELKREGHTICELEDLDKLGIEVDQLSKIEIGLSDYIYRAVGDLSMETISDIIDDIADPDEIMVASLLYIRREIISALGQDSYKVIRNIRRPNAKTKFLGWLEKEYHDIDININTICGDKNPLLLEMLQGYKKLFVNVDDNYDITDIVIVDTDSEDIVDYVTESDKYNLDSNMGLNISSSTYFRSTGSGYNSPFLDRTYAILYDRTKYEYYFELNIKKPCKSVTITKSIDTKTQKCVDVKISIEYKEEEK